MNITEQGILCLLKSAITGRAGALPDGFHLEEAVSILKKHSLLPLAYTGAARCGYALTAPVMQPLFLAYRKAAVFNARQMKQVQMLCRTFESHGIDYMPVKGCNMKQRYPAPELRPMGDADILIKLDQYPQIRPLMLELGYTESTESDHELIWLSKNLMVELHKRLIPSYNKDYYSYYGDGWKLGKFHDGHRFYMCPEDEYIYLFTHFAKHYRDGGIGLRHMLDLWIYRREYPKLDMAYIEKSLRKMQLNEFFHNILRVIDVWFHGAEETELTEFISDFIFSNGSWGSFDNHKLSIMVKQKQAQRSLSARAHHFKKFAFPSASAMSAKYPILEDKPYLAPLFWVRRFFTGLVFRPDRIRYMAKLTPEKVDEYEQTLTYVGLGFHFQE